MHAKYNFIIAQLYLQAGVEVSEGDIKDTVNEIFEENKEVILEQRYRINC